MNFETQTRKRLSSLERELRNSKPREFVDKHEIFKMFKYSERTLSRMRASGELLIDVDYFMPVHKREYLYRVEKFNQLTKIK